MLLFFFLPIKFVNIVLLTASLV